jgi:hypothetical protein
MPEVKASVFSIPGLAQKLLGSIESLREDFKNYNETINRQVKLQEQMTYLKIAGVVAGSFLTGYIFRFIQEKYFSSEEEGKSSAENANSTY